MANVLKTRLRARRDSSTNWASANPTILNGERIVVDFYENGNYKYSREKIGDGFKTYNQLPFLDEIQKNNGIGIPNIECSDDGIVNLSGGFASGKYSLEATHKDYLNTETTVGDNETYYPNTLKIPKITISEEGHITSVEEKNITIPNKHIFFTDDKPSIDIIHTDSGTNGSRVDIQHGNMYNNTTFNKYFSGVSTEGYENIYLRDYTVEVAGASYMFITPNPGATVYLKVNGVEYSAVMSNPDDGTYPSGNFEGYPANIDNVDGGSLYGTFNVGDVISLYTKHDVNIVYRTSENANDLTISPSNNAYNQITIPVIKVEEDGHVVKAEDKTVYFNIPDTKIKADDKPSINIYTNENSDGIKSVIVEHGDMYNIEGYRHYYSGIRDLNDDGFSLLKDSILNYGEAYSISDEDLEYLKSGVDFESESVYLEIEGNTYTGTPVISDDNVYNILDFGGIAYLDINTGLFDANDDTHNGKFFSLFSIRTLTPVYDQSTSIDNSETIYINDNNKSAELIIPHFSVEKDGHVIKAKNVKVDIDLPVIDIPEAIDVLSDDKPSLVVTTEKDSVNNTIDIDIQHGNMLNMANGWTHGYTAGNSSTEINIEPGSLNSTFKVPNFVVETDGHIVKAGDTSVTITLPTIPDPDTIDYLGVIDASNYSNFLSSLANVDSSIITKGDFFRVINTGYIKIDSSCNIIGNGTAEEAETNNNVIHVHAGDMVIAISNNPGTTFHRPELAETSGHTVGWTIIACHNVDNVSNGITTKLSVSNASITHTEVDSDGNTISDLGTTISFAGSNNISVSSSGNTITITDNIEPLTSAEIKSMVNTAFGVSL